MMQQLYIPESINAVNMLTVEQWSRITWMHIWIKLLQSL